MELILKLPPNKPPFIGILFRDKYRACTLNKSWVNNYNTHKYKIVLQVKGMVVDLIITEEGMGFRHTYEDLKYDSQKLLKFMRQTKEDKLFNFGHIITVLDNHEVVKTLANQRLYVLKVVKIKFEMEY